MRRLRPVTGAEPDAATAQPSLARTAALAGIPAPAVRAYARAQLGAPAGCELGWTTFAGIGWVESQHGTLDGRHLRGDGTPSMPLVGPALDGAGAVAAIPADADGRTLHGKPVWDHAVGPMQFLPSTWAACGSDGDADGSADPQDLDDAAASAAAYVCAWGASLTGRGGRPRCSRITTTPATCAWSTRPPTPMRTGLVDRRSLGRAGPTAPWLPAGQSRRRRGAARAGLGARLLTSSVASSTIDWKSSMLIGAEPRHVTRSNRPASGTIAKPSPSICSMLSRRCRASPSRSRGAGGR